MRKIFLLLAVIFISSHLSAQDTLSFKRKVFNSSVYFGGIKQTNKYLFKLYNESEESESKRLLRKHKIMLPVGAATTVIGLALGADALVGTKKTANINGENHTYYERPIFQLLGGLGLIAGGVCIMEFGNDAKIKSVKTFNQKIKNKGLNAKLGFTKKGDFGVTISI